MGSGKGRGDDARRRTAVSHRRRIERIGAVQRPCDVAVGRTVRVERRTAGDEPGVERVAQLLRTIVENPCAGDALRITGVGIPSCEEISRLGFGDQAASLLQGQHVRATHGFLVRKTGVEGAAGRDTASRPVAIHRQQIGETMLEVVCLRKSVSVGKGQPVMQPVIVGGEQGRGIGHPVIVVPVVVIDGERMRRPCGPIETEPGLIAFEKLDPSGKFRIGVLALDTNPEPVRGAEGTITSEGVDLEVVLGVHGVGGNAGVHLAVTQNRNVESVMGVGPHVEIRGVVPSQIDRISQYAVALDGADQQVRRIVGCIVAVLLPLIGNRRNGALHIRERIEHAFGTHSGGGSFAAVHVIGSHGRRGILRAEEPHDTRNGHQTQRAHLDVGICDRDTTSDFRRNAPHLDVGKPQRTAHVGRDRDLLLADHRQHVAVVAMGECEVVRIGFGFEVTAQIGRDTQPIGSRPACKGERRGVSVFMYDDLSGPVAEPKIHVVNRRLIRCTCRNGRAVGTHTEFDPHRRGRRRIGVGSIAAAGICQQQHDRQKKQLFHDGCF